MATKDFAAQLLDKLRQLDQESMRHFYEMGQMLHSFKVDKLYKLLGYDSFQAMIEEEMSFGVTTAHNYANTYKHFKRLGYTAKESHELLYEFGIRRMSQILPELKDKIGVRAMRNRVENSKQVISFWLDPAEHDEVMKALIAMGGEISETGYSLQNSSASLLAMARVINAPHNKKAA